LDRVVWLFRSFQLRRNTAMVRIALVVVFLFWLRLGKMSPEQVAENSGDCVLVVVMRRFCFSDGVATW